MSIPINKEYLALEGELYIGDEKMNIGAEIMNIDVQIDSIKGRIEALSATPRQKEAFLNLVEPLFGKVFGRREVLIFCVSFLHANTQANKNKNWLKYGFIFQEKINYFGKK